MQLFSRSRIPRLRNFAVVSAPRQGWYSDESDPKAFDLAEVNGALMEMK